MRILAVFVFAFSSTLALAGQQNPPDPALQALAYQLQQCRMSADQTVTGAFTLAAKLEAETKRADAEKERADAAEDKLRGAPSPSADRPQ